MAARTSRRPPTAALVRRWLAVGLVALIGFAYYHPLRTWLETRHELSTRRTEVAQLSAAKRELQRRLNSSTSADALAREARRLGYILPGEHLFIVKGIQAWRRNHITIDGDGK
ncbi:MAG: septum formation initiator family protein [Actinobacteria bacterium]|nr:septum formation initiator family protein [Actinomycetota bacterium]